MAVFGEKEDCDTTDRKTEMKVLVFMNVAEVGKH